MKARKQISDPVREILSLLTYNLAGNLVYLPPGQLDRTTYQAVNEVLVAAGGKWDRKKKAHVFSGDCQKKIQEMLAEGEIRNEKKEAEFFCTPFDLVDRMISLAGIEKGDLVLEPSAGTGSIVRQLLLLPEVHVHCYELLEDHRLQLMRSFGLVPRFKLLGSDFGLYDPGISYDRVVMNPPFALEIAHVQKAWRHLRSGGKLVSIMSAGITFRDDKRSDCFRQFLNGNGGFCEFNSENSFQGTKVKTITVVIPKP